MNRKSFFAVLFGGIAAALGIKKHDWVEGGVIAPGETPRWLDHENWERVKKGVMTINEFRARYGLPPIEEPPAAFDLASHCHGRHYLIQPGDVVTRDKQKWVCLVTTDNLKL